MILEENGTITFIHNVLIIFEQLLTSIFPIIAVSVIETKGSATPAIKAGIASLLICLKRISVVKDS